MENERVINPNDPTAGQRNVCPLITNGALSPSLHAALIRSECLRESCIAFMDKISPLNTLSPYCTHFKQFLK